jgi:hypothetical protein
LFLVIAQVTVLLEDELAHVPKSQHTMVAAEAKTAVALNS